MEASTKSVILGRDHETRGGVYVESLDTANAAMGTSAGVTIKPNEDAVGVFSAGSEIVLAIADGHWGREASELGVLKAMDLLGSRIRPARENETRARLFSLFEQVNTALYEQAVSVPGASTPETTLIVCHINKYESRKYLYWASFGDSFLFLHRDAQLKQINSLQPRWLGYLSKLSEKAETRSLLMRFLADDARYVGVASGLETGMEPLEPGDVVFLCTDGLVGSDRDPDPAVLDRIRELLNSSQPLGKRVEKIIKSALARGEKDNISCAAACVS